MAIEKAKVVSLVVDSRVATLGIGSLETGVEPVPDGVIETAEVEDDWLNGGTFPVAVGVDVLEAGVTLL